MASSVRLAVAVAVALPLTSFLGPRPEAIPPAQAHSLANEFTVGFSQSTAANPRSGYISDKLSGSYLPKDWLSLRLDFAWTYDLGSPPPEGSHFESTGGHSFLLSLSTLFFPNDNWMIGVQGDYSPPARSATDTSFVFTNSAGQEVNADARLASQTTSGGVTLTAGYDTAGESKAETAVDLSFGYLHYSTGQRINAIWSQSGQPIEIQQIVAYCKVHGCSKAFVAALRGLPATIDQFRLGLAVTETLYQNTDLGLSFAYYLYTGDPTEAGYFSVTGLAYQSSFGGGVPIAPYQFTLGPDIAHRLGRLYLDANFQYGHYVSGQGYNLSTGLRVQVKLPKGFRVWLRGSFQYDVDADGAPTLSGSTGLGVKWSF